MGLARRWLPLWHEQVWIVLSILLLTVACASMQSTPQQEATWAIMRACDHFPGVWIDRVAPDGRYWVKQNDAGSWRRFQDCVAQQRIETAKAQPPAARSGPGVPLPPDVRVVRGEDVPLARAAFVGKWYGLWDGQVEHILVVQDVSASGASVIYAWGETASGVKEGFVRVNGHFDGDLLVLMLSRPATVKYRMRPDGKLDGQFNAGMNRSTSVLSKMPDPP